MCPTLGQLARSLLLGLAGAAGCAKSDEQLSQDLRSDDSFVRALAAFALTEQAPERTAQALPFLLEAIDHTEHGLGSIPARQLVKVGPRIVPELFEVLCSGDILTLERRAAIIAALEASASLSAAHACRLLCEGDESAQRVAGNQLFRLQGHSVRPLTEVLAGPNTAEIKLRALSILGRIAHFSADARRVLETAAQDNDPLVAEEARNCLQRVQFEARQSSGAGRRP